MIPLITQAIQELDTKLNTLASSTSPVLLTAESGTFDLRNFFNDINLNNHVLQNVNSIQSYNGNWFIDANGILTAKEVNSDKLKVNSEAEFGSKDKRIGITLYDEQTGEPYCIKISGGAMLSIAGTCADGPVVVPEQIPPQTPPYKGGETGGTDTLVSETPAPDPAPSVEEPSPSPYQARLPDGQGEGAGDEVNSTPPQTPSYKGGETGGIDASVSEAPIVEEPTPIEASLEGAAIENIIEIVPTAEALQGSIPESATQ